MGIRIYQLFFIPLFLLVSLWAMDDTISVGVTDDNYPFSYIDSTGNVQGIFVDWWNLWGRSNGQVVDFTAYPSEQELYTGLLHHEVMVLGGWYVSSRWSDKLLFGATVVRSEIVLYSQKLLQSSLEIDDTIGVVAGTYAADVVQKKYPTIAVQEYQSFEELMVTVKTEQIELFVDDQPRELSSFSPLRSRFPRNPLIPRSYQFTQVLSEETYRSAVLKGDDSLAQVILIGTSNMSDSDILNLAHNWHLLQQVPPLIIGAVSALVTLLILVIIMVIRGKRRRQLREHPSLESVASILKTGETSKVEFKSSLRYDYRQKCSNKALEQVIVKTLAAFLNSKGGVLVIGVDDNGEVLGLKNDYQTLNKKSSDGFLLALTALINTHIGKKYHRNISCVIIETDAEEICWVTVRPSSEPVFVGKNGKEEFYIRASVSSQPLSIKESYEYIVRQWKLKSHT